MLSAKACQHEARIRRLIERQLLRGHASSLWSRCLIGNYRGQFLVIFTAIVRIVCQICCASVTSLFRTLAGALVVLQEDLLADVHEQFARFIGLSLRATTLFFTLIFVGAL